MTTNVPKTKIKHRISKPYRLVVFDESTFNTVRQFRFTLRKLFSLTLMVCIAGVAINYLAIAYTPIRQLIPGYPEKSIKYQMIYNSIKLDSLEQELDIRDKYINDFRAMLGGQNLTATEEKDAVKVIHKEDVKFKELNHDSVFQDKIEEEKTNLSLDDRSADPEFNTLLFFPPVKGHITSQFDKSSGHYGIDITAPKSSRISSSLKGTVIFTGYTLNTGYVIQIQHENNIVTTYKHNSEILKQIGDKVLAGEAIAVIGNTGKLSTGPHLHFELWRNGVALNPEGYIDFN